eukprot:ANDGO_05720.mRNA.1 hypothetical protein
MQESGPCPRFFDIDERSRQVLDLEGASRIFGIPPKPRLDKYNRSSFRPPVCSVQWRQANTSIGVHRESVYSVTSHQWPLRAEDLVISSLVRANVSADSVPKKQKDAFKLYYTALDAVFDKGFLDIGAQYSPDGSTVQTWHLARNPRWKIEFHRMDMLPAIVHSARRDADHLRMREGTAAEEIVDEVRMLVPSPPNSYDPTTVFAVQYQRPRWQLTARATSFEKTVGVDVTHRVGKVLFGGEAFYSLVSENPNLGLGFVYSTDHGVSAARWKHRMEYPFAPLSGTQRVHQNHTHVDFADHHHHQQQQQQHDQQRPRSSSPQTTISPPLPFLSKLWVPKRPALQKWAKCVADSQYTFSWFGSALGSMSAAMVSTIPFAYKVSLSTKFLYDYPVLCSSYACGALVEGPEDSVLHHIAARFDSEKGVALRSAWYVGKSGLISLGVFSKSLSAARKGDLHFSFGIDVMNALSSWSASERKGGSINIDIDQAE